MKILTFSVPGDTHAAAVRWGLTELGVENCVVFLTDIPQRESLSFEPGVSEEWRFGRGGSDLRLSGYDSIWFRRSGAMVLPSGSHPADRKYAQAAWREVRDAMHLHLESATPLCVNPPSSYLLVDNKAFQLKIAVEAGFQIPKTLVSSSRDEVVDFIRSHAACGDETICKPILPMNWLAQDGAALAVSTEVVDEEIVDSADVSLCPAIYQLRVRKSFEVRITTIGSSMFAIRLDSQASDVTSLDWRNAPRTAMLGCEEISIPDGVSALCRWFCRRLRIVFACFDFIVDSDGQWIFLECNEMGNFL
ncbi:MAG: hypothetical protein JO013_05835, partial [Alphaproteobacteria bacterium]|nr:hypothetical protein [Alphaproteobacteria bacterium]